MLKWLFWSGIAFVIGGFVSLSMNLAVQQQLSAPEDLTSYSIGWMIVGICMIIAGFIIKKKNPQSKPDSNS